MSGIHHLHAFFDGFAVYVYDVMQAGMLVLEQVQLNSLGRRYRFSQSLDQSQAFSLFSF